MLLRGVVPGDVVEVMVRSGVLEIIRVAYDCLEVAFWRGDEVGVVQEQGPREVVPPNYAVLCKGPGKYRPGRAWQCHSR